MTTLLPTVTIQPAPHPVPRIHRAGFPLSHPYVEQCWGSIVGPSSVLLLRRLEWLWHESVPAVLPLGDLGARLGLGPGSGRHSRVRHTIDRLAALGLADWTTEPTHLNVYTEVPPLSDRVLRRAPEVTRSLHDRFLSAHIEELARGADAATGISPDPAALMAQRLQRLELASPAGPALSL